MVWSRQIGLGLETGGGAIMWGSAADDRFGYFPVTRATETLGLAAVRLATGEIAWRASPADGGAAPVTVIPGVVFFGASTGTLSGYSTMDGKAVWQFDTAREFETVNGVPAKGGSITAAGPVVAGGMVFMPSGYSELETASAGTSCWRSASRSKRVLRNRKLAAAEDTVASCRSNSQRFNGFVPGGGQPEPARSRGDPLEKIGGRAHLRIAAEFRVRDQPHVVVGDVVGDRDQIVVLTRDEAGEHGDAGARTGGGKQGVRAVGLEPDRGGGKNRLEPLRLLQHLIRWRVDEQRKILAAPPRS